MNLFPTICFYSRDEKVDLNFGNNKVLHPFRFDLDSYVKMFFAEMYQKIGNEPKVKKSFLNSLIKDYMIKEGYLSVLEMYKHEELEPVF